MISYRIAGDITLISSLVQTYDILHLCRKFIIELLIKSLIHRKFIKHNKYHLPNFRIASGPALRNILAIMRIFLPQKRLIGLFRNFEKCAQMSSW